MDFPIYTPHQQVDIAVDLGLVPPPRPPILSLRELAAQAAPAPPELIHGILHQGCKMILGGTSKSNKTWALLDLGLSIAAGADWWGHRTTQGDTLYINFELPQWAITDRVNTVCAARPDIKNVGDTFHTWNLRGRNTDLAILRPMLQTELARHSFKMIILDPAYKLLGDRDENSNGEIASLMNEFEAICQSTGAAVVIAHHFAKGDSGNKSAGDRLSGAGAWTRDPDAILILTPHEAEEAFVCTAILRHHPRLPEFCLLWDYPLMTLTESLDPSQIRRAQGRSKICTDQEFIQATIGTTPKATKTILDAARSRLSMSRDTTYRYLRRLVASDVLRTADDVYWKP